MSLGTLRRTWRRARASMVRPAHARRGRRRAVGASTCSRLGARSASPVSALREPSRRWDEESKIRRGDVTRRTAAHMVARTSVDGTTGARTTRSAARGRRGGLFAARRSLGVAGVGSERAEPAMRRGEQDFVVTAGNCLSPRGGLAAAPQHGMAYLTSLMTTATSQYLLVVRSGWGSCEAPCVATRRPHAGLFLVSFPPSTPFSFSVAPQ